MTAVNLKEIERLDGQESRDFSIDPANVACLISHLVRGWDSSVGDEVTRENGCTIMLMSGSEESIVVAGTLSSVAKLIGGDLVKLKEMEPADSRPARQLYVNPVSVEAVMARQQTNASAVAGEEDEVIEEKACVIMMRLANNEDASVIVEGEPEKVRAKLGIG